MPGADHLAEVEYLRLDLADAAPLRAVPAHRDHAFTSHAVSDVLPEHRGDGVGAALLESVWQRLAEMGIEDLTITTASTYVDSHRFYERHGFAQGFVIYYGTSRER